MSIEVMKQALVALEYCKHLAEGQRVWGGTEWSYPFPWKRIFDSTTKSLHTIRTAIEQAEKQEPVAWMVYTLDGKSVCVTDNPSDFSDKNRVLPLYTDPPAAQPEKQVEPFGYFQYDIKLDAWVKSKTNNGVAFYTTPPAAQSQDIKSGIETVAAKGGLLPQQEPVAWIFKPNGELLWPNEVERKNPLELNEYAPLYTTPPAAQSQDLNGGHQLDVAGRASTATITKRSYRDCGSEGWFIAETVAAPGGLLPQQEPVALGDLLGAVARGWGHSKNAHKEMDSDLALAIAEEVKSLLKEKNT